MSDNRNPITPPVSPQDAWSREFQNLAPDAAGRPSAPPYAPGLTPPAAAAHPSPPSALPATPAVPTAPGYTVPGYPAPAQAAPGYPAPGAAPGYPARGASGYAPTGYGYAAPGYGAPVYAARPTNGLATAAMICGIVGFVFSWAIAAIVVPVLVSITAVVLGHISLRQIKRNPALGGRGMALTGLILGYIPIAFSILLLGFVVLMMIAFGAATIPFFSS